MHGSRGKNFTLLFGGLVCLLTACAQSSVPPAPAPIQIPAQTALRDVPVYPLDQAKPWVLVDTRTKTLKVLVGNRTLEIFNNIAFGSSGAGIKRYRGDSKTPLGVFRIGWLNDRSRFNIFFGLDYPNLDYAERAYQEKLIDQSTYYTIRRALQEGRTPPQDTRLGGHIGIHGLGAGSPVIHAGFDWTDGCIALNNQQIMRLAEWVGVGTRVVIR